MSTSRTREKADGELFKSTGIDDNATSTAVTIDASENVFIGQTSLNTANNGHSFGANGNYAHHTSTESTTLILNRKTSDGDIVRLRKDNAEVGSINTGTSRIGLRSGDTGIMCAADLDAIYPQNDLAGRDAAINLGVSGARFKDLYLSGGVYLGGIGGANKLQDYETGTWTPTWQGASGQSGQSYSTREASYTKIGRAVHIQAYMNISDRGNFTNGAKVAGLPFTVSPSNQAAVTFGYHSGFNLNSGNSLQGWVYSGDFFYLYQGNGSTDSIALVQSATDSGPTFHFSFTYFTNQ